MLEVVKQNGHALMYASPALRDGGLSEFLTDQVKNVFNISREAFISTILFGAKAVHPASGFSDSSIDDNEHDSGSTHTHLCDNSGGVLGLLGPSSRLLRAFST